MDVEGKVSLHQLTNFLESVVEEQSDGERNKVINATAVVRTTCTLKNKHLAEWE